jgi:hypothetical protein
MCEDFVSNFGDKKSWLLHHDSAPSQTSFSPEKGHHFHTTEVIEADLQAVLNTPSVHEFQGAFKKWQKCWERCIRAEGFTSRLIVASKHKVIFSPNGRTSPRN